MSRGPRAARERQDPPLFEVCVHGQPVSAQTGNRQALQAWKKRIREACQAAWPGRTAIEERAIIRVTHYYESRIGDVDNLIKPIQDALQGIAYLNDRQIDEMIGNRRNINGSFRVRHMSPSLAMAFSDGRQFVHIRIWQSRKHKELG